MKGMLLHATKDKHDNGLGPLAYEMTMAAHLMRKGFDVEFHDMEAGGGCDFLARKDGLPCLQVECKFVSANLGRKIPRKHLYMLGDRIMPTVLGHLDRLKSGMFVRVDIPDRLTAGNRQQGMLGYQIERALLGSTDDTDGGRVTVRDFDPEEVIVGWNHDNGVNQARMEESLKRHFGIPKNSNVLVYVRPPGAILVLITSARKDTVLKNLLSLLKESTEKQLSSESPAIICCQLADVTDQQLVGWYTTSRQGTGLDAITDELFESRPHLLSATYTVTGHDRSTMKDGIITQEAFHAGGPAYTITNSNHPHANNKEFAVFS